MLADDGPGLMGDPKDYWTRVRCPVLAVFGEQDILVPAQKSADLYAQYLAQAGNRDVSITVFPGVGHSLGGFMPEYWDTLSGWLQKHKGLGPRLGTIPARRRRAMSAAISASSPSGPGWVRPASPYQSRAFASSSFARCTMPCSHEPDRESSASAIMCAPTQFRCSDCSASN